MDNIHTPGIAERSISTERILNAPRELVWKVWTESEHIKHWRGPNGFTNTIETMDVKPGGVWEFTMRGPDGVDYKNKIVYTEVQKPELLIYDHVSGPKFHVTVKFEDHRGKTKLSMQMLFKTRREREKVVKKYGAVEGLNQTLGRLEEYLLKM